MSPARCVYRLRGLFTFPLPNGLCGTCHGTCYRFAMAVAIRLGSVPPPRGTGTPGLGALPLEVGQLVVSGLEVRPVVEPVAALRCVPETGVDQCPDVTSRPVLPREAGRDVAVR